jgi:DNA-binding NarL/FixJ family response regulator
MPKCILIVDDHAQVRKVIRYFIESQPGFQVSGEAEDGIDAIEKAKVLNPELIIVDLSMPRTLGLEASRALRRIMPSVPVVLFTMYKDAVRESDAVDAGISAVVSKTDGMDALVKQVQNLLEPVV